VTGEIMQLQNNERDREKNMTRFGFLDVCQRVVGFLINKILWVVGNIKIKISCLVGKLKPTQLICVVFPQY
jgi:hypothetical protein